MPLTVLVINAIVVREVRRASNNAAVNLRLQQHQQSTSSDSAVPTVLLIATSFSYVLLCAPYTLTQTFIAAMPNAAWCSDSWAKTMHTVGQLYCAVGGPIMLIYAYNFFVYVVTGKQFRRELRRLCCCSSAAGAAAHNDNAVALRDSRQAQDDRQGW